MLTDQRKQYILNILKRDGQVIAKALSQELGLSEDTIRRDLRELAQEGLLQRVHGGALPASPAVVNFAGREQILVESKVAIGRAAARLIKSGQVVILDGGTTCVQIARHLPGNLQATIVTHSATIAVELLDYPGIEVILIGGRLFKHSVVSVGAAAIEAISHIRADVYFMGVTGIHPEAGLSTGDLEEAYVKYALCKQAAETLVLASQEKLGAASQYVITSLSDVTGLIVEQAVPDDILLPYIEQGLTIIRA
ncbi:MAG TPA: DeoR/GlpR family DNA-binding transcription regulator [Phototrophicaceae bacterium]|jgi:DeoR/GlpR family transcriptional regulator of sugar metabolism|nr:DeoR/GlpR family DNA-binding transcription regulator [Phototrophicaceae bacterium]